MIDHATGNKTVKKTWYNAIKCSEKYANFIAANPKNDIVIELEKPGWICPDIDEISLLRDPYNEVDLSGFNFIMIVNDCGTA